MPVTVTPGDVAADSYIDLAGANSYHTARANSGWSGSDTDKEAALRRATAWLDGYYRHRWPGSRLNGRSQALEWPRSGATDSEGLSIEDATIPPEIEKATAEAALIELGSPGALTPSFSGRRVTREKVGPLEVSYADDGSATDVRLMLSAVEDALSGIIETNLVTGIMTA